MKNKFAIKNLFVILLLSLSLSDLFSQTADYSGIYKYGISGNLVFKSDTAGNTIWVKDFSGKICPTISDTNHLQVIVFDGNLVYISSMQTDGISFMQYYPSIIVMDSNGVVRNISYQHITSANSYSRNKGIRAMSGGAWFFDDYSSGIRHDFGAQLVDTNGTFVNGLGVWFISTSVYDGINLMEDSSYLLRNYSYDPSVGLPPMLTLTHISQLGLPLWQVSLLCNLNYYYISNLRSSVDSLGNTIAFFDVNDNFNYFTLGVIINPSGITIASMMWPADLITSYGRVEYSNNEILYDDGLALFHFNYQLQDSCLRPSIFSSIVFRRETLNIGNSTGQIVSSYLPINHSPITTFPFQIYPTTTSTSQDFCLVISTSDNLQNYKNELDVYPNPASDLIHFTFLSTSETDDNFLFEIYNFSGRKVKEGLLQKINQEQFSTNVNITEMNPGFYFVKMIAKDATIISCFIKN